MSAPSLPKSCATMRPLLPGFVGEELADEQLASVHAHLRECLGCRRDAADYMQATKALQRAALAAVDEHDVPFEHMHSAIMQCVTADDVIATPEREHRLPAAGQKLVVSRLMMVAAAVLLTAFGFWLAHDAEPQSIWERRGGSVQSEGVVVLPYAGSQADIQPVGLEVPGGVESGVQTGMSARGPYRMQVEPAVLYRTPSAAKPVGPTDKSDK